MTATRKNSNGNGKATSKRVPTHAPYHEYHEFQSPTPAAPHMVLTENTATQQPLGRLIAIISSVVIGTAILTWRVAAERSEITKEVATIQTQVHSLAQSVAAFSDSVKELNGNLKWMASGTWSRGDMIAFCKDLELLNSGKAIRCPTVTLSTGALK